MNEIVKQLKRIAEQQGVSQANLARRMKVTETSISRWFNGTRTPTIENVEKIADALNCCVFISYGRKLVNADD